MIIGEHYFSVEFNPINGKFTVRHCLYSGSYSDFHIEQNHLALKQYDQAQNLCDSLNNIIKEILCTNITK